MKDREQTSVDLNIRDLHKKFTKQIPTERKIIREVFFNRFPFS